MDKMSLLSILTVSVPEAILLIILTFVLVGNKQYFSKDKWNVFRIIISALIVALSSSFFRGVIRSPAAYILVIFTILVFMFRSVFRLPFARSLMYAAVLFGAELTIEIITVPIVMSIFGIDSAMMYSSDYYRFICSLPIRGLQLFFIISLWNTGVLKSILVQGRIGRYSMGFLLFVLLGIEVTFAFLFTTQIPQFSLSIRLAFAVAFFCFAFVNMMIVKLISGVVETSQNFQFEQLRAESIEMRNRLEQIKGFIQTGDLDRAEMLCKILKEGSSANEK